MSSPPHSPQPVRFFGLLPPLPPFKLNSQSTPPRECPVLPKKLPKRLNFAYFWARTRIVQKVLMVGENNSYIMNVFWALCCDVNKCCLSAHTVLACWVSFDEVAISMLCLDWLLFYCRNWKHSRNQLISAFISNLHLHDSDQLESSLATLANVHNSILSLLAGCIFVFFLKHCIPSYVKICFL